MTRWHIAISSLFALLVVPFAHSQQSGVLIGVQLDSMSPGNAESFEQIHPPHYRTLWIAPDSEGKLGLLATISDLIVPRKDGFWHVGVSQLCEFSHDPADEDGGNESISQPVWRAPITKPGIVPATRPCTPHDPGDYAPPYGRSGVDKNKISQCGYQLTEIHYVSPVIISLSSFTSQSEDCEPRGGHYKEEFFVMGYDSDQSLSVSQALGEGARTAYLKALPKEVESEEGGHCSDPTEDDTGWRVDRLAGRWAFFAHQNLGYFGCSVDARVPFRLPGSVTGDLSSPPDLKLLKTQLKTLQDAFLSPELNLLIAQTDKELLFYQYSADGLGKLLLTLPAYPIVMVQWATTYHVQEWTQQLQSIVAHPLPGPQIQLPSADPSR